MSLVPTNPPSVCMTIQNAHQQYTKSTTPHYDHTETSRTFYLPTNYEGYPSWCDHSLNMRYTFAMGNNDDAPANPELTNAMGPGTMHAEPAFVPENDIQSKAKLLDLAKTLLFGSPNKPGLGPILTAHCNRQKALATFANGLLFDRRAFCGLLANYLLVKERKARIRGTPAPTSRPKKGVGITAYRDRVPTITFPREAPPHLPSSSNPILKVWSPTRPPPPPSYAQAVAGPSRPLAKASTPDPPTPMTPSPSGTARALRIGRGHVKRPRKKQRTNPPPEI
ncbi:hypothetical protein FOMPIDRAFT_1047766 [Fomitopsis schrenkii]|uniref:Uncharacterized protein n=1 Tax=Fomitopsis schrenkii TaxID=2126942 RepID=S8FM46_FOMSC|nr:hypothetical protein FOMPIDRAFT_1047766 [Fomitopsis schrenkii]